MHCSQHPSDTISFDGWKNSKRNIKLAHISDASFKFSFPTLVVVYPRVGQKTKRIIIITGRNLLPEEEISCHRKRFLVIEINFLLQGLTLAGCWKFWKETCATILQHDNFYSKMKSVSHLFHHNLFRYIHPNTYKFA